MRIIGEYKFIAYEKYCSINFEDKFDIKLFKKPRLLLE